MPIIQVNLLAGRPMATKQRFMRALTDAAVATLDVPIDTVRILLNEIPPEHWATGGQPKKPADEREKSE